MNKYIKTPGTPGKKKTMNGKIMGDSGQVNYTATERRGIKRLQAADRQDLHEARALHRRLAFEAKIARN